MSMKNPMVNYIAEGTFISRLQRKAIESSCTLYK
jgi:hypothetical protein